ncbi:MAG: hypothetical protein H7338_10205 [Candidatus Sericytochromatia bacterium]|nr:hypothetical protein [Candidatus Sericytochromatia bacterium]
MAPPLGEKVGVTAMALANLGFPRRSRARRSHRQRGQALVEYALALTTVSLAFLAGAHAMSGIWEAQLASLASAMSADSIKSAF